MDNAGFWDALDELIGQSALIIDRPKGSAHPRYGFVYDVDYGYLENSASMDGGAIDVWRGTDDKQVCDAVICTVDLVKRDSEIKLLIGCTEAEKTLILRFHNESDGMKGFLLRREN